MRGLQGGRQAQFAQLANGRVPDRSGLVAQLGLKCVEQLAFV